MNKIIKVLLIISAVLISIPSMAQEKVRAPFTRSAEVRFSIGAFPKTPNNSYYSSPYHNSNPWGEPNDDENPFTGDHYQDLFNSYGARTITGAISVNISYNILRWLSVGATFTYSGEFQKIYSLTTKEEIGNKNSQNFMITPMVRFNYLNRTWIRLYSQVGIGLGYEYTDNKYIKDTDADYGYDYPESVIFPTPHITYFGISVGRKLIAFAEFGYGSQGTAIAGIGYKF